jgi:hypothetical protein
MEIETVSVQYNTVHGWEGAASHVKKKTRTNNTRIYACPTACITVSIIININMRFGLNRPSPVLPT